jgi:CRP/FNR family transcriptional regulator
VSRLYFEEGTLIFGAGDVCRELLIVEEGTVKMVKSALSGRQQLLGIERKGSSLAEVAVFDSGRYPASAEATSSTTLVVLFSLKDLSRSEHEAKHRAIHTLEVVDASPSQTD